MMPRAFCLAPLTVLGVSPTQLVSIAATAGYTHVGLRLIPVTAQESVSPLVTSRTARKQFLQQITSRGLQVLDIEVFRLTPQTRLRDFVPLLEIGAELGASDVLVTGNDADQHRLIDNFAQLSEWARPLGLFLNLEPTPWTEVPTVNAALHILRQSAQPNQALLIDPIHFYRANNSLAQLSTLPLSYFRYMQVCDGTKEILTTNEALIYHARNTRLSPGQGDLDVLRLLSALPTVPLSIECANTEHARRLSPLCRARQYLNDTCRLLALQEQHTQNKKNVHQNTEHKKTGA